nr:woronin body major protein [Quercus suber]
MIMADDLDWLSTGVEHEGAIRGQRQTDEWHTARPGRGRHRANTFVAQQSWQTPRHPHPSPPFPFTTTRDLPLYLSPSESLDSGRLNRQVQARNAGFRRQSPNALADHLSRVPFSVFPSAYKNEQQSSETTEVKTEERVTVQDAGREGRSERITQQGPSRRDEHFTREDIRVTEQDRFRPGVERVKREEHINVYDNDRRQTRVEFDSRQQYREPYQRYSDAQIDVQDRVYDREHNTRHTPGTQIDVDTRIDVAERDYRTRTVPFTEDYRETRGWEEKSTHPRDYPQQDVTDRQPVTFNEKVTVREERTVDPPRSSERKHRLDMGYYDNEGQYHSFRHGLHKAADRVLYGKEHHHHHEHAPRVEEDVVIEDREITMSAPRYSQERRYTERSGPSTTITIPCHHIRIGDLLILQGRPCQVIRITTSAQTGQHRYLGVDLFTKQLHEESSFVSNPSPSVVVQNMVGPVFKQYRVLDIREDGKVVAMTETGDVKQGLPVLDQSSLLQRLSDSFENGRGSVRVLVINDDGRELAVDYKVVHGSRL